MKRVLCATVLLLMIPVMSLAQDFPRYEIYGGYSAQRLGIADEDLDEIVAIIREGFSEIGSGYDSYVSSSRFLKKGFEGAMTVNVNRILGITVDARYNKDSIIKGEIPDLDTSAIIEYKDFSVLAGPRFALRNSERVTPFAHALFGLDRGTISGGVTFAGEGAGTLSEEKSSGIGIAIGGGLDVNLGDHVALRLAQVDYYLTRHYEEFLKNVAFSGGIVFRFGWDY